MRNSLPVEQYEAARDTGSASVVSVVLLVLAMACTVVLMRTSGGLIRR